MRLIFSLVLMSAFGLGQMALAQPPKSAVEVMDALFPETTWENIRLTLAKTYANVYAKRVQEHAIQIRDRDKFADLLPRTVTQVAVDQIRQRTKTECLTSFSDDDLSRLVERVSQMSPGERKTYAPGTLHSKVELSLVVCLSGSVIESQRTLLEEDRVPPLNQSGFLADILETNGVASFPNRIMRKNFLQGLRDGTISIPNRIDLATH